jgi:hypothetical protein
VTFSHYYHVFADGPYVQDSIRDHMYVLRRVDADYRMVVGLVGSKDNRQAALESVQAALPAQSITAVEAETGWEHVTLEALRDDITSSRLNHPVLYSHTKGASAVISLTEPWRRCMEENTVGRWREALRLLDGHTCDVVGVHWLSKQLWPNSNIGETPFFGGNYWWATPEYLSTLPELGYTDRWEAERWLGMSSPTAVDLVPGHLWPGMTCSKHTTHVGVYETCT